MAFATLRAVLRDPFYRYEVRRYWTWQLHLVMFVALAAWLPTVWMWARFEAGFGGSIDSREMPVLIMLLSLLGRAPLSFAATTGAALCLVSERVSGQIEQFVLTPMDPWRYCLARLLGRLRGLAFLWVALGGALLVASLLGGQTAGGYSNYSVIEWLLVLLVVLIAQLDLAVMLLVDAAVGTRFTSTSASVPAALIKTYLTNFLLTPFATLLAPLAGFGYAMGKLHEVLYRRRVSDAAILAVALGCAFAIRLTLGALAVWMSLRDTRNAIHKTFYQPEDRP